MKKFLLSSLAISMVLSVSVAFADESTTTPVTTVASSTTATTLTPTPPSPILFNFNAASTTRLTQPKIQPRKAVPAPKLSCIQSAVEKRENALVVAIDAHSTTLKTALTTRGTDLKAAWGISNNKQRQAAINAAWSKYNRSAKTINENLRKARNQNWQMYELSRRKCGVQYQNEEGSKNTPRSSSEATNL